MIEKVRKVQAQVRAQARKEVRASKQIYEKVIALAEAQLQRAGAKSPARVLAPADIQHVYEFLKQAFYPILYREFFNITPYVE